MKLQNIKYIISRTAGRSGLVIRKYSPEILIGVGIVGVITSTVMACKASTKAEKVVDDAKAKLDKVHEAKEMYLNNDEAVPDYTETDYKKDLMVIYVQTGVEFVKLYGPAVTLGLASIGCILGAHGIMKKRNLALVAAYKAVEESFANYRKRVVEEYGEDKDYQFKNGIRQEKITVTETDENGKSKKVTKTVETVDANAISQYARFFDESCTQWTKIPEYNLTFLKCQQNYFNDMLKARGHVFLNEVYDALGIDRTQAGAVVGWVKGEGDNFIDFGIFDGEDERKRAFVNGYERSILLDFNVSGVIYDMI